MTQVIRTKSWRDFKLRIDEYSRLSARRREQIIFRGQADSQWSLVSTLDRRQKFVSQEDRDVRISSLIRAFKRGSVGAVENTVGVENDLEWELLGRHHGLPTPILDWTESPYIAAFFAFDDAIGRIPRYVSIWVLDCEQFESNDTQAVEIIESDDLLRFNLRAVDQRAVFVQVNDARRPLAAHLSSALIRYDIPGKEAAVALADLDGMNVNARVLFRNLDGAARLADRRLFLLGEF